MLDTSWADLLAASWVWFRNKAKSELHAVGFASLVFADRNGAQQLYSLEEVYAFSLTEDVCGYFLSPLELFSYSYLYFQCYCES